MFNSKLLNYQRVLHFNNPPIYSLKSWQLIHPPPGEGLRPLSATSKTPSKMSEDLQFQLDLGELHETPKSTISPWYSHDIPMMCSLYPYYIPMTSLLGGWTNPTDKYESQIGSSSQLLGKIKIMFQTTNQILIVSPNLSFLLPSEDPFLRLWSSEAPDTAGNSSDCASCLAHQGIPTRWVSLIR